MTSDMQSQRTTNCATTPFTRQPGTNYPNTPNPTDFQHPPNQKISKFQNTHNIYKNDIEMFNIKTISLLYPLPNHLKERNTYNSRQSTATKTFCKTTYLHTLPEIEMNVSQAPRQTTKLPFGAKNTFTNPFLNEILQKSHIIFKIHSNLNHRTQTTSKRHRHTSQTQQNHQIPSTIK